MPRHSDIDAAVRHLGQYSTRDEWIAARRAHVESMLGRIAAHFEVDVTGVFEEVDKIGHAPSLLAFLDESFFATRLEPGRTNVTDDYLRRRGWQETPRAREYLQGIRDTPPSLYEVHDVEPGQWIEVRDRLRGGVPLRIVEHTASQTLQRLDCFVARVVQPRDGHMLTAGVLSLSRAMADDIEALYRKVEKRSKRGLAEAARELGIDASVLGEMDDALTETADRLCLHCWLKGLLAWSRRPPPELHNTDGDPLLPSRTRLTITSSVAEVAEILDGLTGWSRDTPDDLWWTWSASKEADFGNTVFGTARIEGDVLHVETNSRERMERALAMLQPALGTSVGRAVTVHEDLGRDLEAAMRSGRPRPSRPAEAHSPAEAAALEEVIGQALNAHYRRTLDEPVPALGNRTPRECARTKGGRLKLVAWLKDLENGEGRRAALQHGKPHDLGWMWVELGVEDER